MSRPSEDRLLTPNRAPLDNEIEGKLFSPGSDSLYLLTAFGLRDAERRVQLEAAADWLGLDNALDSTDVRSSRGTIEQRWINTLHRCERGLRSPMEKRQLAGLLHVLAERARRADGGEEVKPLVEDVWKEVSAYLRGGVEPPPNRHDGLDPTTLQGRRWASLRSGVSAELARMIERSTLTNLLPRGPRDPVMFDDTYEAGIKRALRRDRGFVVISAEAGSGRSELALAYASNNQREYERVFVLRATDRLRLEQDFLEMATIIAGDSSDRGSLRRQALEYLEEHDGWLIVLLAVAEPQDLESIMPWADRGHVLCTADESATAEKWATFNVDPIQLHRLRDPAVPGDSFRPDDYLGAVVPEAARSQAEYGELLGILANSRHATALAHAWFGHTEQPGESADESRDRLAWYVGQWASTDEAGSAAARAAEIQLRELSAATRWRQSVSEAENQREADALELLCRLAPFVADERNAATFQAALLDHERYADVADHIDDPRLELLSDLLLADRHTEVRRKYFHVNLAVLEAVERFTVLDAIRSSARASAARTLVSVLSKPPQGRRASELAFELLPHIRALGKVDDVARPMLTAELRAYAALSNLQRRRRRDAASELDLVVEIIGALGKARPNVAIDELESWADLEGSSLTGMSSGQQAPDSLALRMARLVKALRMSGFPDAAARMYTALDSAILSGKPPRDETYLEIARLRFEAALAFHDLDDLVSAGKQCDEAGKLWRRWGDRQCQQMSRSLGAELEFDAGRHANARSEAEAARADRVDLLLHADSPARRAVLRSDIARSDHLLARIAYEEGHLVEAHRRISASVHGWQRVHRNLAAGAASREDDDFALGLEGLNELSGRSYLAVFDAVLGNIGSAADAADTVHHDLRRTPHRPHAGAIIGSNIAQTYRLAGRVQEAVQIHATAAQDAARGWSPGHRLERLVRSAYADSLIDAGRAAAAFETLMKLLEEVAPERPTAPRRLITARVLSSLGRLFVENSLAPRPLDARNQDRAYLTLGKTVLKAAQVQFERAAQSGEELNPGLLACKLSLLEAELRERSSDCLALAEETHGLAEAQFGGESAEAAARSRLVRARAIAQGDDEATISALEAEVAQLVELQPRPVDRLDIALAHVEVMACRWELSQDGDATVLMGDAKKLLDAPLESMMIGQVHQLTARIYAELAALAERCGLPSQLRSRNLRERDRCRPVLEVGDDAILTGIPALLASPGIAPAA